jgi:hypothetical protein
MQIFTSCEPFGLGLFGRALAFLGVFALWVDTQGQVVHSFIFNCYYRDFSLWHLSIALV